MGRLAELAGEKPIDMASGSEAEQLAELDRMDKLLDNALETMAQALSCGASSWGQYDYDGETFAICLTPKLVNKKCNDGGPYDGVTFAAENCNGAVYSKIEVS